MRIATAAGVAERLGTTEAKLNTAYSDAQKAGAKARVDAALAAGNITEKYATELKAQIDAATFPGFGAGGRAAARRPRATVGTDSASASDSGIAAAAGSSSSAGAASLRASARVRRAEKGGEGAAPLTGRRALLPLAPRTPRRRARERPEGRRRLRRGRSRRAA